MLHSCGPGRRGEAAAGGLGFRGLSCVPMRRIAVFWRSVVDVREGERLRTLFMSLYLLATLFSYYIMKPAARGMFLGRFKVDDLPLLNILLAAAGGVFAYLYTRLAVRTSLRTAVAWSTALSVISLALMWWLLGRRYSWMLYVFSVWVSMFSIVMVTQCWLVAANLFNSREAKRIYNLLGLGAVTGAAFGGTFTSVILKQKWVSQTHDLLWWSALWIAIAYGFYWIAASQKSGALRSARAAGEAEAGFSITDILGPLARHRHLQVIISITLIMLVVDVIVEFQFQSILKQKYETERAITAFIALYTGTYLNVINFVFQFFLTAVVVRLFGVGGTLQIMPATIAAVSAAAVAAPGVVSTTTARLAEATTRYTLNRTGMELLYLPLPLELRNRTKAFIDIFVDRLGRGAGGLLLLVMVQLPFTEQGHNIRPFATLALALAGVWAVLAWRARNEYVATIRKRIESRRLDLESVRVRVQDPGTIRLLEETAAGDNPRQATYALGLLAEAPGYNLEPLLRKMSASPQAEVRAKVFEIARSAGFRELYDEALKEIRSARGGDRSAAIEPAVAYAVSVSPEGPALAARLLDHPNFLVARAAVNALGAAPDAAQEIITHEWLSATARADSPERRSLAAIAIKVRGDEGTEALFRLLADPDPATAVAACEAAGKLGNPTRTGKFCLRLRGGVRSGRQTGQPRLSGPLAPAPGRRANPRGGHRSPGRLRSAHRRHPGGHPQRPAGSPPGAEAGAPGAVPDSSPALRRRPHRRAGRDRSAGPQRGPAGSEPASRHQSRTRIRDGAGEQTHSRGSAAVLRTQRRACALP